MIFVMMQSHPQPQPQPQPDYRFKENSKRQPLTEHYYRMEQRPEIQALNRYCYRPAGQRALRILSWNMHGFQEARRRPHYEEALQTILGQVQPDMFAMMEHSLFAPHEMLSRIFPYYHMHHVLALYSKTPFQYVGSAELTPGRYLSDYVVGDDVHLYITHLCPCEQSVRLDGIKKILEYKAYHGHRDVILVGDFNHVDSREYLEYPEKYSSRTGEAYINIFAESGFDKIFCDSFIASMAPTPTSTHWTGTRIDYVFITANIHPIGSYLYHTILSDHMPIIVDLVVG